MNACPFCRIISGDQDRPIIFENESIIAFMPLRPSHEGHVLVMPKAHYKDIYAIPEMVLMELLQQAKRLSWALKCMFGPPKVAMYTMGLEVEHAHMHLIPVFDPYDLTTRSEYERRSRLMTRDRLEQLSDAITNTLSSSIEHEVSV